MGKSLKNTDDTSNTFADSMVRVEALSTVGKTVALAQSPGVDAGCTVRGSGSRAAGTRVMTYWEREWEMNTKGPKWLKSPLLGWVPYVLGSPLLDHSQSLFSSHTKSKEEMCKGVIISLDLPTLPNYTLLSMLYLLISITTSYLSFSTFIKCVIHSTTFNLHSSIMR